MGTITNTYIDEFFVTNKTNRPITLGDLVNCLVPAKKKIDLLKVPRVTKEKINQSQALKIAINNGILVVTKPKKTSLSRQVKEAIIPDLEDVENIVSPSLDTKAVFVSAPNDAEIIPLWYLETNIIVQEIRGITDTGTVTFNIIHTIGTNPYSGGTNIPTASIVADTDGETQTRFFDATVSSGRYIVLTTSAISSATKLNVTIKYLQA